MKPAAAGARALANARGSSSTIRLGRNTITGTVASPALSVLDGGFLPAPGAATAPATDTRLRVPKGTYISQGGRVQLLVQARSIQIAAIRFSGRFTPRAGRALGTLTVRTPRCGRVGPVEWTARRQ